MKRDRYSIREALNGCDYYSFAEATELAQPGRDTLRPRPALSPGTVRAASVLLGLVLLAGLAALAL